MASGVLRSGGWFTLRCPGGQHLVEGAPAAYWPDGSVKWLHLCGQVDLLGGRRNEFTLTPARKPAAGGLRVDLDNDSVKITGGEIDVEVAASKDRLLAASRNGKPVLEGPGLSAQMVYQGPEGENRRQFDLEIDGPPSVVVRTANRVVVRVPGYFPGRHGRKAAELILFIEVLRQSPELRIQPVFLYLGRPEDDLVGSLTLTAHTPYRGEDTEYAFANEQGRGYWDVLQPVRNDDRGGDGPRWPQARQVQLGASFYVTEKRTDPRSPWVKALEGRRSRGWCHLATAEGGVTAAMRYFWQEYPHSLSVDADAGTVTFGLVPAAAAPLDLRRYSGTIYGAAVYEAGEGSFNRRAHGATGIAKAHELMLRFGDDRAEVASRALSFVEPVRPMSPPEQFAASKAIGHVAAPRRGVRDDLEAAMTSVNDFLLDEREFRGWYGLMNYGDIMCGFYAEKDRWAFDEGGYAWINTEHLPDYGLWISALRTARADRLDGAVAMTRHNRDVDMYHRGRFQSLGTRHNVNHWGCYDKEWRVTMPLVKRLHYYVTADPWTAEVIASNAAIYQSYVRTSKIAPSQTSVFAAILTKWEMSNDPADAKVLEAFADGVAAAVRNDGMFIHDLRVDFATGQSWPVGEEVFIDHFFMNGFGGQHALVEYAELTGHKALSDALVRHARYYLPEKGADLPDADHRHRGLGGISPFLAFAYRRTGDKKYKDALAASLRHPWLQFARIGGTGILEEPPHTILPNVHRKNKIGCSLGGSILHKVPYGLAVL